MYENGDIIEQKWNGAFVVFAFLTAFVASHSAVRLLDHHLWWRQDDNHDAAAPNATAAAAAGTSNSVTSSISSVSSAFFARAAQAARKWLRPSSSTMAAIMLGFGTVWSMHFLGMSAVALVGIPTCYNHGLTALSLVSAVLLMAAGCRIASHDIFHGKDRSERLREIVEKRLLVPAVAPPPSASALQRNASILGGSRGRDQRRDDTRKTIWRIAYFHQPQHILLGGFLAASGALIMHYTGMAAKNGPFVREWNYAYIAGSVVVGVTACIVGFWIIFRLFHWKIEEYWLRPFCAAIIASAVCGLHFLGMLSVTYIYHDDEGGDYCAGEVSRDAVSAQSWTTHQIFVLSVSIVVWSLAVIIENSLYRELLLSYVKLYDPTMSISMDSDSRPRARQLKKRENGSNGCLTSSFNGHGGDGTNPGGGDLRPDATRKSVSFFDQVSFMEQGKCLNEETEEGGGGGGEATTVSRAMHDFNNESSKKRQSKPVSKVKMPSVLSKFSSICYADDGYSKSFIDAASDSERSKSFNDVSDSEREDGMVTSRDSPSSRAKSSSSSELFSVLPKEYPAQNCDVVRAKVVLFIFLVAMTVTTAVLASQFQAGSNSSSSDRGFIIVSPVAFGTAVLLFLTYEYLLKKREVTMIKALNKASKIVNDHFPEYLRDRMFSGSGEKMSPAVQMKKNDRIIVRTNSHDSLQGFLRTNSNLASQIEDTTPETTMLQLPPLADLFASVTVMFADISGFTAWSSERQPTHVFILLERLFHEFDRAAKRYNVYKVETIGDCYVAVTGLPNPTPDHAGLMVNFAQTCLRKFESLVNELEESLGPGTAELGLRIGLHSGPVTAGVIRGKKSRFQLFGDTMNVTSRIECSGETNEIHVSSVTAELLIIEGKADLLVPRNDMLNLKGKGLMKTYFVKSDLRQGKALDTKAAIDADGPLKIEEEEEETKTDSDKTSDWNITSSISSRTSRTDEWINTGMGDEPSHLQPSKVVRRLVTWNVALLEKFIVEVLAHRQRQMRKRKCNCKENKFKSESVTDAVRFPAYDHVYALDFTHNSGKKHQAGVPELPEQAKKELTIYVQRIASTYKNTHFHNFEHASHVTMSASKLMNQINIRRLESIKGGDSDGHSKEAAAFFNTYSISMDPLAQLAVVFASLTHDADHKGVPNQILMKEQPDLACKYDGKSVAENNSIHLALSILEENDFDNLRSCMFENVCDENRFRQLLINLLIATDIADKERMKKEERRWERAFACPSGTSSSWEEVWRGRSEAALVSLDVSLKATVVLEQIMLASDVAHTMQHWLTFVKWNERLYKELWAAHVAGRNDQDPTENWYEGQIGFFDFYIIPLARKLNTCGVFGSAGKEYLNYALSNRQEWTEKGKEITSRFERTFRNTQILDEEPKYWEDRIM
ncbi:hypothetical protein ACHAXR_009680 [Thalassiosira sp. AJA248-18]